jgi:hypothetical protein
MKSIFVLILVFSSLAEAGTWKFKCSGTGNKNLTDTFSAIMDSDKGLISINTTSDSYPYVLAVGNQSTDLGAIDPSFFDADFSKDLKVVIAEVTTYNYFNGRIKFFFGTGLEEMTKDVQFSIVDDNSVKHDISVEYDDGDGFGFSKRTYSCQVTRY